MALCLVLFNLLGELAPVLLVLLRLDVGIFFHVVFDFLTYALEEGFALFICLVELWLCRLGGSVRQRRLGLLELLAKLL